MNMGAANERRRFSFAAPIASMNPHTIEVGNLLKTAVKDA